MIKKISALPFFGLILIFSCSKKSDPAPNLTPEQIITNAKGWIGSAATINPPIQVPGGPAVSDFFAYLPVCEKDDVIFFGTDGKFKIDEGATKCDSADPQIKEQGTWAFNGTKTAINIQPASGTGDPYTMTISELTATTLKISEPFDLGTGTAYTVSFTYSPVK